MPDDYVPTLPPERVERIRRWHENAYRAASKAAEVPAVDVSPAAVGAARRYYTFRMTPK